MKALMCVVAVIASTSSIALGQISYVSQTRQIGASAGIPSLQQAIEAPDFGPFVKTVLVMGPNPDNVPDSFGKSTQNSELLPYGMILKGTGEGKDSYSFGGAGIGIGYSLFDITFEVAQPVEYALEFGITSSYHMTGSDFEFELTGSQGTIFFKDPMTPPLSGLQQGTLPAGTYTFKGFVVDGWIGASLGSGKGSFNISLLVDESCYPDCDGDAALSVNDFICYQTFFALGDPYADCTGEGILSIDDFICFQTMFAIGCNL